MHPTTERLAEKFSDAAEKAADAESFVAMRSLVKLLGAEFRAQPLLYEGLVAEPRTPGDKWVVVVDSHASGYDAARYEKETSVEALPPRLRFTIAHELGHVVQLKSREGNASVVRRGKRIAADARENALEREADALSPLLMVPHSGLDRLCREAKDGVALTHLLEVRKRWAVSREVLVHRLGLLGVFDPQGFRFRPALKELAVGLATRGDGGSIRVAAWPHAFCNFSDNLVPDLLQRDAAGKRPLTEIFQSAEFRLNGGSRDWDDAEVFFGTAANPRSEKQRVRLTVEQPSSGGKALFLLRRV
jgi:hypothetical protein